MLLNEALKWGIAELKNTSPTPSLDAKILLEFTLKTKELLFLKPETLLNSLQAANFKAFVERRAEGEPIAYITGIKEFYGMEFEVCKDVLIPRPDTELLVLEACNIVQENYTSDTNILLEDICTGSGCIAISILSQLGEYKNLKVTGVDISPAALQIATNNALKLLPNSGQINFIKQDLLSKEFCSNAEVVVSNPPYIAKNEIANLANNVKDFEPLIALDGGEDGLLFYKALAEKCKLAKFILLEIGLNMEDEIIDIFRQQHFILKKMVKDINQINRCLVFYKN